ncbi:MAG: minor capsid protein [Clostridia bacterium]|nr:minor capsid protein [Clostridia bacterium]
MSVDYTLKLNTQATINRFNPKFSAAQRFLDSEVLRDSAPYVPMRTGTLMKSGQLGTVIGSGEVRYNAPYASKCYYGKHMNFSKDKHPQACAQWFEKAKAIKKKYWISGANKIVKE